MKISAKAVTFKRFFKIKKIIIKNHARQGKDRRKEHLAFVPLILIVPSAALL